MYSYNIMEWLLFFYIYCFFGWIWECLYVSVCKAKWVNRGFMHGPFLPIYGTGATAMLFLTIPVKSSIALTFFVGMFGATVLELITGAAMEKMFGVRYWDYSDCFLNLKGHICLKASLLWGVFSVLLVNTIHTPVEKCVKSLSFNLLQIVSVLITAVFSADFSASFREALDLKELLVSLTESNEELRKIEKYIEGVTSVIGNEVKEISTEKLIRLNKALENNKKRVSDYKERINDKRVSAVFITKQILLKNLSFGEKLRTDLVDVMIERINIYIEKLRTIEHQNELSDKTQVLHQLEDYKRVLQKHVPEHKHKSLRAYMRSMRLLRRNPDAVSGKYHDALIELVGLDDTSDVEDE